MSWLASRLDTVITGSPSRTVQVYERLRRKAVRVYFEFQVVFCVHGGSAFPKVSKTESGEM